ncbi:COMM domain-containing protein 10-like [Xenia sp. Carnegie-2017]|uniref:COMM domain-containing protein 10-like n=1 Tax=Xenia sp. Carnegie-2017 TaxID=2897299 RepID=UPI001F046BC4|nr:COMM domain-containing protein 10-like [Xenia sp. Carnegie-2017]
MAAQMFNLTTRLKNGVSLINDLDAARFPLLLSRIIGKFTTKGEKIFSEDEHTKLCNAFKVDSNNLQSILDTSVFILEQAAYHTAKPANLAQQLKNIQLVDDKVEMFVNVWKNHGKNVNEELKQRSIAPKQLESVKWRLNLQMAEASRESDNLLLEFTHEELYSFYDQLEQIKSQLDALR